MFKKLCALGIVLTSMNSLGFTCKGEIYAGVNKNLPFTLEVKDHEAIFTSYDLEGKVFSSEKRDIYQGHWDGHRSGLIVGDRMAIKFENHYGVTRFVEVQTDMSSSLGKFGSGHITKYEFEECHEDLSEE